MSLSLTTEGDLPFDNHVLTCHTCTMKSSFAWVEAALYDDALEPTRADGAKLHLSHIKAELERLRADNDTLEQSNESLKDGLFEAGNELERLRDVVDSDDIKLRAQDDEIERLREENKRLRAALNKAGDRLAQVQPGITEPWAFDIVPRAEQEIADALK